MHEGKDARLTILSKISSVREIPVLCFFYAQIQNITPVNAKKTHQMPCECQGDCSVTHCCGYQPYGPNLVEFIEIFKKFDEVNGNGDAQSAACDLKGDRQY